MRQRNSAPSTHDAKSAIMRSNLRSSVENAAPVATPVFCARCGSFHYITTPRTVTSTAFNSLMHMPVERPS